MPFFVVRQDITKIKTDAIVNPANTKLLQGSGTSCAIFKAAGEEELSKCCANIGECQIGNAVITPGFNLEAKYIIHAVGPIWMNGIVNEEKLLYSAYKEAMRLAQEYGLGSIAFPVISAGNYKFPIDKAILIARQAIEDYLHHYDMIVYLVLYDKKAVDKCKQLDISVEEQIDDIYVANKDESFDELYEARMNDAVAQRMLADRKENSSLEEQLTSKKDTFTETLFKYIDESKMSDVQVYKKANIDRKLFSKIRSNADYTPSKRTIICFILALELSYEQAIDFLMKAGYTLSDASKFDVIISYYIKNKIYDIYEINQVLFSYNLPLLC